MVSREMKQHITKAEMQAFMERWEMVNSREIAELRSTPVEVKLRQLAALMASVDKMGWREKLQEETADVRQKWVRLREKWNG